MVASCTKVRSGRCERSAPILAHRQFDSTSRPLRAVSVIDRYLTVVRLDDCTHDCDHAVLAGQHGPGGCGGLPAPDELKEARAMPQLIGPTPRRREAIGAMDCS